MSLTKPAKINKILHHNSSSMTRTSTSLKSKERKEKRRLRELFTHHTIFKFPEVTLLPCVSEEFDVSACLAQSVSWMAGVGHLLDGGATVQPQETQLDHISTWIVKLMRKE